MIPVFRQQIENGGSVRVTYPDIVRFFGTMPEAVSLVTLAGVCARVREIFVLDRVSPMKIDALARNLIKRSEYRPDVDIRNRELKIGNRQGRRLAPVEPGEGAVPFFNVMGYLTVTFLAADQEE